jgi:hypothetical protein
MAALPVAHADAAETTASLRAKRQVLVTRIASLTDEAERAQLRAASAVERRQLTRIALDEARRRFATQVVGAYLDGVQDAEGDQLRRRVWGDTLADAERQSLAELRAAKKTAEKDEAAADAARSDAKRALRELDAARAKLERTIADRVTYEKAKAKSAPRPASTPSGTTTRHRRATGSQGELMARYRFGPGGVPEGLVRSGEIISGRASWYGPGFDGRATASGAIFDQEGWTVANRTLPLGTILLITHGDRSVVALVNDRGPFVGGRILDLSHGVANALGTVHAGVASVTAEILVPA